MTVYYYCAVFSYKNYKVETNGIFPCGEHDDPEDWLIGKNPLFPHFSGYIKFYTIHPLILGQSYRVASIEIFGRSSADTISCQFCGLTSHNLAAKINDFLSDAPQFTETSLFPSIRPDFDDSSRDEIRFDRYTIIIERCEGILKEDPRK